MNNNGPRIVINKAKVISTNSVHRLYYIKKHGHGAKGLVMKQAAISLLSTFSQLSAEMEGRVYGAGVLKHEPSEAKNIKLVFKRNIEPNDLKNINDVFKKINQKLREGKFQEAQELSDDFVLSDIPVKERNKIIEELQRGLTLMRVNRSPKSWKG